MRIAIAVLTVIGTIALILNVRSHLTLLDYMPNASAVQVTEVYVEAQTVLLGGILGVLTTIACAVLNPPRPKTPQSAPANPAAEPVAERVTVPDASDH